MFERDSDDHVLASLYLSSFGIVSHPFDDEPEKVHPDPSDPGGDCYVAWCMVEAGLGITLNNSLNSVFSGRGARCVPLSPRQTIQIGIASLEDCSPATRAFLEEIQRIE